MLLAFICFLGIGSLVTAQDNYLILCPKEIRPGMTFTCEVELLFEPPAGSKIMIALRESDALTSELLGQHTEGELILKSGVPTQHGIVELMPPPDLYSGACHNVHISAEGIKMYEVRQVCVNRPLPAIYLVTDKPIYKTTGETVRFMVINVDATFQPKESAYRVDIMDADDNHIFSVTLDPDDSDYSEVYKGELLLPPNPVLGTYKITVTGLTDGAYRLITFVVEEYILPKYEVLINLDAPYAVSADGEQPFVEGVVLSKYTYGQNVLGVMKLYVDGDLELTVPNFNGLHRIRIPLRIRVPANGKVSVNLMAEVIEQHTEIMANGSSKFSVYSAYTKAEVVKPIPYRSSSDDSSYYSCEIGLKSPMGGALGQYAGLESLDLTKYKLRFSVNNQNTYHELPVTSNPTRLVIRPEIETTKVDFNQQIKVWFVLTRSDGRSYESAADTFTPVTYQSNTNQILNVELEDSTDQEVCFYVKPCAPGDIIFYQVINNYYPESLMPYTCQNKDVPTCITLDRLHAPMSLIVAYKVYSNGKELELLSASIKFDKTFETEQKVEVNVTPSMPEPGDEVTVEITAKGRATAALIGLDKSVELLGTSNDLTDAMMEISAAAYRIFDNRIHNPYPNPVPLGRGGVIVEADDVMRKKRALRKRRSLCWICGGSFNSVDTGQIIQEAGLLAVTNIPVHSSSGEDNEDDADAGADDSDLDAEETESRVRRNFEEVWLWNLVRTDADGKYSVTKQVPDTITSWNIKAFAINAVYGLGVAPNVQMTVFKAFFVYMNLPYSVVRGELFTLQILVFNYLSDQFVEVDVVLASNAGFEVVSNNPRTSLLSQRLRIAPGASESAEIPISPTIIGNLKLLATATNQNDLTIFDSAERILLVKAEGYQISDSMEMPPFKFTAIGEEVEGIVDMRRLLSRSLVDMVEDSFQMILSVTGDIMGAFLDMLGAKPRLPSGCGEQNIKSLAPTVMVAMYFKSIGRFDGEIMINCQKYAGIGYTRQLKYKHITGPSMGSYSAWGQRGACTCRGEAPDPNPGSTWLTAFVLRMFCMLAEQELTYVSRVPLQQAYHYLMRSSENRTEDNFFNELGPVIHSEMQGGTSAGIGLTAFVTLAIMDYRDVLEMDGATDLLPAVDQLLDDAIEWLRFKTSYLAGRGKAYQLAMAAYTLARHSKNHRDISYSAAKSMLEEYEKIKNNVAPGPLECPGYNFRIACKKSSSSSSCSDDNDCPGDQLCCYSCGNRVCKAGVTGVPRTGPTITEMNSYALLAYTELAGISKDVSQGEYNEQKTKAEAVVSWLLERRKPGGNFETTQDTVVGLEALTRFSVQFKDNLQANFHVKAKVGDADVTDWVEVIPDNSFVSQSKQLAISSSPRDIPSEVKIIFEGATGTAYASVEAIYNTEKEKMDKPFKVNVLTYHDRFNRKVIESCVRNQNASDSLSSMVLVMVQCGSGYLYDGAEYNPNNKVSKVEFEQNECQVNYYYDVDREENLQRERCYRFYVTQNFNVQRPKSGNILVYDYYNPETKTEYTFMPDFSDMEPTTERPTTGASHCQISVYMLAIMTFLTLIFTACDQ